MTPFLLENKRAPRGGSDLLFYSTFWWCTKYIIIIWMIKDKDVIIIFLYYDIIEFEGRNLSENSLWYGIDIFRQADLVAKSINFSIRFFLNLAYEF